MRVKRTVWTENRSYRRSQKGKEIFCGEAYFKWGHMGKKVEAKQNKTKRLLDRQWVKNSALVLLADILVVYASFFLALFFRFDLSFGAIPDQYLTTYLWIMPLWCLLTCVVFYKRGIIGTIVSKPRFIDTSIKHKRRSSSLGLASRARMNDSHFRDSAHWICESFLFLGEKSQNFALSTVSH